MATWDMALGNVLACRALLGNGAPAGSVPKCRLYLCPAELEVLPGRNYMQQCRDHNLRQCVLRTLKTIEHLTLPGKPDVGIVLGGLRDD
jgi:hypothetical protein